MLSMEKTTLILILTPLSSKCTLCFYPTCVLHPDPNGDIHSLLGTAATAGKMKTVLITGASAGLGKESAFQLAAQVRCTPPLIVGAVA